MAKTKSTRKSRKRKTGRRRFRYRCRACGKRFNNKKNGRCPNCRSKNIQLLGTRSATQVANKSR